MSNIEPQITKLLNSKISLRSTDHKYVLDSNKKIKFISATEIVDKQFPKFNPIEVSRRLTTKVPKYQHLTAAQLREEWKKKRDYGSKVHKEIENSILYNTPPSINVSKKAIKWLKSVYKDYELLTEVIIFDTHLKVAGTIDLVVVDKKNNSCILIDWKTTEKLTFNGFAGKTGITNATKDLQDSKYDHYCLQLSIYRFLLEERWNINVDKSYIIHLTDNRVKDYTARYYEKNVKKIFKIR
tara:strand:+ start:90 stop:809 length:720 start_codon:yes stop_codon:yes gene_type:complete